ncbi:hypothetical protein DYB34_002045 [Aphanomyces astaci]|uniref:Phospholipid/glycerol acyltransferase domain-containing protein n=1 Tax=Aphanomyces astaci TaxID=112090 RepID=A0A418CFF2_APHAT|nr:hypothetical protein DYB34_002045 [Aphanomyces astaci]
MSLPDHESYTTVLRAHGGAGNVKIAMKHTLRSLPVLGTGMSMLDFLFLRRDIKVDRVTIQAYMQSFVQDNFPFWLVLFPEGTTIFTESVLKSHEFATAQHRPVLHRVMLPRSTGLKLMLDAFKDSPVQPTILDVTMAFPSYSGEVPTYEMGYDRHVDMDLPSMKKLLMGHGPSKVHFHCRHFSMADVGDDVQAFLDALWVDKEALLNEFIQHQVLFTRSNFRQPQAIAVHATDTTDLLRFSIQHIPTLTWLLGPDQEAATVAPVVVQVMPKQALFVFCFGSGLYGRLGVTHPFDKRDASACTPTPLGTKWLVPAQVACGKAHTAIIDANAHLYCFAGQLGFGDTTTRATFTQNPHLTHVHHLASGMYHAIAHTKAPLAVVVWGCGGNGRLGLGDVESRTTPADLTSMQWKGKHPSRKRGVDMNRLLQPAQHITSSQDTPSKHQPAKMPSRPQTARPFQDTVRPIHDDASMNQEMNHVVPWRERPLTSRTSLRTALR